MKSVLSRSHSNKDFVGSPRATFVARKEKPTLTLPPIKASMIAKKVRKAPAAISLRKRTSLSPTTPTLSNYSFMRTIGTGSFARVRLAITRQSGEVVVVKSMSKSLIVRRAQMDHVLSEKQVLSSLSSPFIVELKAAFQDPFFLYLVLEYIQGGELYHLLAQTGYIEPQSAKLYASEVVCALSYLHSQSVVYRDLKPENVLIAANGHIKLADFGFAKMLKAGERTFTLCGTPEYLAPEVITSTGHDYQCDWWALGVLLYEMLAGRPPFTGETPFALYEAIVNAEVAFPMTMDLTARSLIAALLIKAPGARAAEQQVKSHQFFAGVDWTTVEQCKTDPPYKPKIRNPMDARNFDQYPEEDDNIDERKATDPEVFRDF